MPTSKHYTIEATNNYCTPKDSRVVPLRAANEYSFTFMLDENCLYYLGDSRYDNDLNKLVGISRNLSLQQSGTRIGWSCAAKTMEELRLDPWFSLRAYVEENNKRVPTSNSSSDRLASVRPRIYYDGRIKFRAMTQDEIDRYKFLAIPGTTKSIYDSGYNYISEINVSISSRKDSNGNYLNSNYTQMVSTVGEISKYIKGATRTIMPMKKPSPMGYYHYYPYFGGDYPLGCPHDMDIHVIHDY